MLASDELKLHFCYDCIRVEIGMSAWNGENTSLMKDLTLENVAIGEYNILLFALLFALYLN